MANSLHETVARVLSDDEDEADVAFDALRSALEDDSGGRTCRVLLKSMQSASGDPAGRLAYLLAEHYLDTDNQRALLELSESADSHVRSNTLNALWGTASPMLSTVIVEIAIKAVCDPASAVRQDACRVLMNQCDNGVDVSAAVDAIRDGLKDKEPLVRQAASYALGHLAKKKYQVASAIPQVRRNVKHKHRYLREASANALWQLSRSGVEIGPAVPELVWLLTDPDEYNEPRKMAAGALLQHSKKSPENALAVKHLLRTAKLDRKRKEVKSFLDQLAKVK